jgi:4-hydroxybenzoate polyprenyltransferase
MSVLNHPGFVRIKLFLALSRTPHGLLDMATPALCAMLWLGTTPSPTVILLGFLTAFAGYTAVYALNDVVDYRIDKEKAAQCGFSQSGHDLDALCVRHPLAQGLLSLKEGILWTVAWGMVGLLGAYTLNPACAYIFIAGCVAEAIYCLMLQVSYLRTVVSGAVKTAGGMAAVYAVTPDPSFLFLIFLFLWLFSWEIGGQNVPNDWTDMKEDKQMDAETIPVRFGPENSAAIIFCSLAASVLLSFLLYWVTPARLSSLYLLGAALAGTFMLLLPAYQLYRTRTSDDAFALFNRASYYPLAMLVVVLISQG